VGVSLDAGGAPMATRMVGGFILVAFLLCILLAWPGQRRWPVWLITGICGSTCAALALSVASDADGGLAWGSLAAALVAFGFVLTAVALDLRDPVH
jgi:peptidoglycan/LPS O-acetylase OafA/YrhL